MIGIVSFGSGNLRSVRNALEHLGVESRVLESPAELSDVQRLVLPGVGAFGDAMANLTARGFAAPLVEEARSRKPLLGICLGMQLLGTRSSEYGEHAGLDLIPGDVERLEPDGGLRVPHMGWNGVSAPRESRLLSGLGAEPIFYFVHSYELRPADPEVVTGTADYGGAVTACVERGSVMGAQFHPEKSQRDGLGLLRNFLELPC